MPEDVITGEHYERAEKVLSVTAQSGPAGLKQQYVAAKADEADFNRFMKVHLSRMRSHIPDMDPRIEAGVTTYFRHALLVGMLAERSRVRPDDERGLEAPLQAPASDPAEGLPADFEEPDPDATPGPWSRP